MAYMQELFVDVLNAKLIYSVIHHYCGHAFQFLVQKVCDSQ